MRISQGLFLRFSIADYANPRGFLLCGFFSVLPFARQNSDELTHISSLTVFLLSTVFQLILSHSLTQPASQCWCFQGLLFLFLTCTIFFLFSVHNSCVLPVSFFSFPSSSSFFSFMFLRLVVQAGLEFTIKGA